MNKTRAHSYRQLQSELNELLKEMQSTDIDIDRALDLYKKGQVLINKLQTHLEKAKIEIEKTSNIA